MFVLGSIPSNFLIFLFSVYFLSSFLSSLRHLVSRSCSTYLDKETTFYLLKISSCCSVSHDTMADLIVSFDFNRVFWYKGQVLRKYSSSYMIG